MLFNYILLIFLPYTAFNHGGVQVMYTYNVVQCETIAQKVLADFVIKPRYECMKVW